MNMFPIKRSKIKVKTFLCLIPFAFCLSAYSQSFKPVSKAALTSVGNSTILSFDADLDGKPDILVMGKDGSNYFTKLYHNNGDSTFLDLGIAFPGLADGSADVIDFNNDGLPDVVICGNDGTQKRFCLFKNKGNNLFSEVTTIITGVDKSTVKCADLNRDGWADIVLAGQSATAKIFKIYKNNGNGTFTEAGSLEGFYDGDFDIADIDHDDYPDIVATGVNTNLSLISKVYINSRKNFLFNERTSNIPATRSGKISFADFNNDGYADVIVTGKDVNLNYIAKIYRNNAGETFTHFASLTGLFSSTLVSGDLNNDGFPDIVIAGTNGTAYQTIYYINNAGNSFMAQSTTLPNVNEGSVNLFDLTTDNRLDLLVNGYTMSGPVTKVFNNDIAAVNAAPNAPSVLTSFSQNDSVVLRWKAPADDKTASKALTYDFYIKSVSNGDTLYTAPANFANGNRYLFKQGQLRDTFVIIKNLPYGKYSWGVQAIDQSYQGSAFATEQTFNICYNLSIGKDTSICKGSSLTLSAGLPTDNVNWYSSVNPLTPFQTGNTLSVTVSNNIKVWVTVTKPIGCSLSDTINLSLLPLPDRSLRDTGICQNSNITLSLAHNTYKGNWSSQAGSITVNDTAKVIFKVLHNDKIFVKITSPNGCSSYDTASITAHALPKSYLPVQTSVCFKDTLHIVAGTPNDSVYWFNSGNTLLSKDRCRFPCCLKRSGLHSAF